jgi:hypothetical protein
MAIESVAEELSHQMSEIPAFDPGALKISLS